MTDTVFPIPAPILAPVAATSARFPVRRIFCIGRNYAAHAREMGKDPDREPPFFFTKWAETVVFDGATIPYPPETSDYQYEAELVIALGARGFRVDAGDARKLVFGYACGLDMTRRDLQGIAKKMGRPWDYGKNFEHASPLGVIHPASETGYYEKGAIALTVNGQIKQKSDVSVMLWDCDEIIAHISKYHVLDAGDLIYTGTPEGVGAVNAGDTLRVTIERLTPLTVTVGPPMR